MTAKSSKLIGGGFGALRFAINLSQSIHCSWTAPSITNGRCLKTKGGDLIWEFVPPPETETRKKNQNWGGKKSQKNGIPKTNAVSCLAPFAGWNSSTRFVFQSFQGCLTRKTRGCEYVLSCASWTSWHSVFDKGDVLGLQPFSKACIKILSPQRSDSSSTTKIAMNSGDPLGAKSLGEVWSICWIVRTAAFHNSSAQPSTCVLSWSNGTSSCRSQASLLLHLSVPEQPTKATCKAHSTNKGKPLMVLRTQPGKKGRRNPLRRKAADVCC